MKRLISLILTAALVIGLVPCAFAAVGDTFNINFYDAGAGYISGTTAGENWAVDTSLSGADQVSGAAATAARVQIKDGVYKFTTVNSGRGDFAVKFTAPNRGAYSITANVTPYASGGTEAEVYVNGTLVGKFSSRGTTEEGWEQTFTHIRKVTLNDAYLYSGELANTLVIRPTVGGNAFLEGFTLTEVEAKPMEVTLDFPNSVNPDPSPTNKIGANALAGTGFVTVAEESSAYTSHDNRLYTNSSGDILLQVDVCGAGSANWITSNNSKDTKWTLKMPITAAGWYNVKLLGGLWYANASFYVYVNDKYAGYYSFDNGTPEEPKATWKTGENKPLNTLYLEPDADGYVKIAFAYAKPPYNYTQARMQLMKLTLTPTETQEKVECVDIVHTIPGELAYGESVEFTAYAVMSDGTTRRINGYKADATADSGNSISVTGNSSVSVKRTSNPLFDDGTYTGAVTGVGVGENTVTLTAMVDGVPYTEEATVNIAAATEPVAFSMEFIDDGLSYDIASAPLSDWTTSGYEIVLDKTTTASSRRYSYSWGTVSQLNTGGGYVAWPNLTTDARATMITFKKTVPYAGYYDIDFTGYLWSLAADYSVYINGEYAGQTNCYNANNTTLDGTTETTNLNTLYLPAGDVEVSFRARNSHYTGAMFFTPVKLDFTPATVSEVLISNVQTSKLPTEMAAGETYDGTAQALMNDGLYRSFGYNDNGQLPTTDNVIKVTSSNPAVVAVTDAVCVKALTKEENEDAAVTVDPTTTTYTLNALRAGSADITVTAMVDGKVMSVSTNITVTGGLMEESVTNKNASVSVVALEGGSVTTSIDNVVSGVEIGTEITAEATANEGYRFAYWENSNGAVISENAKESFVINSNTSIKAYFEKNIPDSEASVPVYFYNGNGEVLSKEDVERGKSFEDVTKPDAVLTGFAFDRWSISDDTVINDVTRAVALFKDSTDTYTVTVIDGDTTKTITGKSYGDSVTVTAAGDNFSYWMLGDDVVSYDKSFTMKVYGNKTLTAAYTGAKSAVPTVAFETVGDNHFLTYNVPAGYTKLEAGIIFSKLGTPRVGACYSKATEKTGSGQFTAKPLDGEDNIARGYVMFKDADGNIKVIYAD